MLRFGTFYLIPHGAAWSDAGVIVPWTGWMQSGDTRIIDENRDGVHQCLAAIE